MKTTDELARECGGFLVNQSIHTMNQGRKVTPVWVFVTGDEAGGLEKFRALAMAEGAASQRENHVETVVDALIARHRAKETDKTPTSDPSGCFNYLSAKAAG